MSSLVALWGESELSGLTTPGEFASGTLLFSQGDEAEEAYLVLAGQVELELAIPGSAPLQVGSSGAGELLGEPALFWTHRRTMAARARGDVSVALLDRRDFLGLLTGRSPVAFRLMMEVARLTAGRLVRVDRLTTGPVKREPAPAAEPLGTHEQPGCAFDPAEYLPLFPFFRDFKRTEVRELLSLGTLWTLPRGRGLLRLGQRSRHCFVVVRGAVEATNPHTGERLALFGPGELLGQVAPLLDIPVISDARMREPGVVLELGPEALTRLWRPQSILSYRFLHAMVRALLAAQDRALRVRARAEQQRRLEASDRGSQKTG